MKDRGERGLRRRSTPIGSWIGTIATVVALIAGTGGAIAVGANSSAGGPDASAAVGQYCPPKHPNCRRHHGHHGHKPHGQGNVYRIHATFPRQPGTRSMPRPIGTNLKWVISTTVPGQRPAGVSTYTISILGLRQNTGDFPACGASQLSSSGPFSCPPGSNVGSGFAIVEVGPRGHRNTDNVQCRIDEGIFNGGQGNLILYLYSGQAVPGQPPPCHVANGSGDVNVNLSSQRKRLTASFSFPLASGSSQAVLTEEALNIPATSRIITQRVGRRTVRRRVGLLESFYCPPSHRREVAITFTRQNGSTNTHRELVRCSP